MATVEKRPRSEWSAVLPAASKKDPKWLPLVSQIEGLSQGDLLAIRPEEGETIRALKVQVARAANSIGRKDDIEYGEADDGKELQVRLREKPIRRRGPRKPRTE